MSTWTDYTVEQVAASSRYSLATGPFGSAISSRYFQSHGVPVIRGGNLSQDVGVRLVDENWVFLSEEKAAEFSRSIVRRGDLIFTCWGTVDQVGLIDDSARFPKYVISNKQMKLTPDPDRFDSRFLYYLFKSHDLLEVIRSITIGSSVPGFNLGQLRSIRLRAPGKPEQSAIADVLGALDDKIQLNRSINRDIDGLAAALFNSWFVDFDPVTAKRDGRTPIGVPPDAVDLFPSHFEESAIGAIPRGWTVTPLAALLKREIGGVWGVDHRTDEAPLSAVALRGIDCHALAECIIPEVTPRWFTERQLRDRTLKGNEVLIEGSGSFCGRSLLVDLPTLALFSEPVTYSNFCKRFDSAHCSADGVLAWFALRDEYRAGSLDAYRIGSAFPNFDADGALTNIKLALPDNALRGLFEGTWRTFRDQQVALMAESRTLAELRDTLLGPLVSGELSITAAEKAVGTAV